MIENGGWEVVREALRRRVGASAYKRWFRTLDASLDDGRLVVRCPDRFSRNWIRDRYGSAIREASGGVYPIDYTVDASVLGAPEQVTLEAAETRAAPSCAPRVAEAATAGVSFESFVSGPGNALALEGARALATGRAGHCSPLVIAGGTGQGKSHLCLSIRNQVGSGAVYRSSEEFTSEVTGALRNGGMESVRRRYRRELNVLILEDVHFLAGKRATQIELFHTLDSLMAQGKPVVFSANRPPHEIPDLDDGLRSRMSSGLVACIGPPELETRRRVLGEKAAGGGVRVPEECLEMLARRPAQSVRDLVGGLNQVVARSSLLRRPVTLELVTEALCAVELSERPRGIAEIIELVCRAYGMERHELESPSRKRRVVRPRQIAMYLCRRYTEGSLQEIGRAFDRDHTSVMYAIDVVERRIVERPQLRYELEALATRLSAAAPPRSRTYSGSRSTRRTRRT